MSRSRWSVGLLTALLIVVLAVLFVAQRPDANARPLEQTTGQFSFAVKYVCGFQRADYGPGEPQVKPGNYATEINIQNFNNTSVDIRKRVLVLVKQGDPVGREPNFVTFAASDAITLPPQGATMDDCNRIWQLLYPGVVPPTPMPVMIGYLMLYSPTDLNVDAVYTASAPGQPGVEPSGTSIDVERVAAKRIP